MKHSNPFASKRSDSNRRFDRNPNWICAEHSFECQTGQSNAISNCLFGNLMAAAYVWPTVFISPRMIDELTEVADAKALLHRSIDRYVLITSPFAFVLIGNRLKFIRQIYGSSFLVNFRILLFSFGKNVSWHR